MCLMKNKSLFDVFFYKPQTWVKYMFIPGFVDGRQELGKKVDASRLALRVPRPSPAPFPLGAVSLGDR